MDWTIRCSIMDDTLIPKYVDHLLKRRTRLSKLLRNACCDLDEYCAKIGVDFNDPDACLLSDIRIYCEQDGGESLTRAVIERTLRKNAEVEKNRGR